MERFHPICDARSRVSRNIIIRAERLARSGSVPGMDAEDIKQDLRLHLYRCDDRFDPSRGQYDTFADRVLANRIATLAAPTERLRAERAWVDFDTPSEGRGNDEMLPLAETLPDSEMPHAAVARAPDEAFGLVRDVRRLLAGLTPTCRDVALALIDMSPTEAAEALGIHRSTVYARLGTITEDALAATFAARHAETWRYVAGWGQWLTWSGKLWRREETLQAFDLARMICREAAARAGSARLKAKLSSAATVSAVERLARSDRRHATTTEPWDRDPWLLNTPGGVVDLRSGASLLHDPGLFMTRIAGASVADACPVWLGFLETVTGGDGELQSYLQRMAGYCLTGVTTEHALFFLYGTGANGKSVFANTLTAILGDYATVAPMDMFMATQGDRHPTDMAGLRGARIVTSIETEQGSRWAESKLKALTGGDKITARFMRQDFFEFIPQFKLLIVGNHKPSIRNVDEAMKRRLHMVPFTVTIPPARRDKHLADRLLAERDGILAWALEGCIEWQRTGLRPPPAVMAATEDYFEAEDAIGRWIDERCSVGLHLSASTSAMFADWKAWADANGEFAGSVKRFSEALIVRGFERHNTRAAKGFRGIALDDSNSDLFSGE